MKKDKGDVIRLFRQIYSVGEDPVKVEEFIAKIRRGD